MEKDKTNDALNLGAWTGRRQAFAMLAGKCSAADAECLRTIRDSKQYRKLGLTWTECCTRQLGISRTSAEKVIGLLNEFGPQYFELSAVVRITPEEYRRIAPAVTREGVQYGGRVLEIAMENAPQLSEAVQELRRQTAAVITEEVPEEEFERALDRARRSAHAGVKALEEVSRMEMAGDRRTRYMRALRESSHAITRLMEEQVSGKVASWR